ncbi:MAG TPA: hypothetical protein VN495_00120, partial [Candidatus Paceibacterota bacterium]|nr:hypothetical protein [Candidatus Paceibacterota bacterium]
TIVQQLGVNEYTANDSKVEGGKKRKRVTYFLAESPFTDLHLGSSGGLDDAQWFPLSAVGDLNFYDDTLKIIIPAINALARKGGVGPESKDAEEIEEAEEKTDERVEDRTPRHYKRTRRR